MKLSKIFAAGLVMGLFLVSGANSQAGSDLNEVGALLVYPAIVNLNNVGVNTIETFVTITNAGPRDVLAHVSYINGDATSADYCDECDFSLLLTPNDTETLVVTFNGSGIAIESEDSTLSLSCAYEFGMMIVALEDPVTGETLTDNVLLGEEVVLDYINGQAISIPAVSFQGGDGGNGDKVYSLDDSEYGKMPRIVAADFLAPGLGNSTIAALTLFTLGFDVAFPPVVDCSVTGFDARENAFSASLQFGCWTAVDLCDISTEFCTPNLGLFTQDTHGWLQLNCRVDENADGTFDADGGVHGAIIQTVGLGANLQAGSARIFAGSAAWARLLYQSVTTGDSVTLFVEGPAGGLF